jgi:hypothetical protein
MRQLFFTVNNTCFTKGAPFFEACRKFLDAPRLIGNIRFYRRGRGTDVRWKRNHAHRVFRKRANRDPAVLSL